MDSTGGEKGHVSPLSGQGQTGMVGGSCKNFCARHFSPFQFLIACSTNDADSVLSAVIINVFIVREVEAAKAVVDAEDRRCTARQQRTNHHRQPKW